LRLTPQSLLPHSINQVSWIIAPTEKSEHASNHPAAGEDWTARLLKALENNPSVYAKTAFILNYDEGGQFFDHSWSPTPPVSPENGISTG
jgi:phospholipase C